MDHPENNDFDLSKTIIQKLTSTQKSNEGIFFTPVSRINKCIDLILDIPSINIKTILEPSCGSCEFIKKLNDRFSNTTIIGIEKNEMIYDEIQKYSFHTKNENKISLIKDNFLKWSDKSKEIFDLIIGNPPFFVIKKKEIDEKYYDYFEGRPNIYIIFIIICLHKLNENGILMFVLPLNFTNCLYYNQLRKHIFIKYKIINIIDCREDKYIDTQQDTIVIIFQKINYETNSDCEEINSQFVLEINQFTIFNTPDNIIKLKELYKGSTNLYKLQFDVSVGTVVWNQVKDLLSNDPKDTRLIYSSDIKKKQLIMKQYKNNKKKNYINKDGLDKPILVLNRGYGKGKYILDYCLIDISKKYLIENHLICIRYVGNIDNKELLLEKYNRIIKSFDNPKTMEFISIYFGNNAINTTELKNILPIYS
jgi:tRNA1(Val) A37 N6-methylase TrmN6